MRRLLLTEQTLGSIVIPDGVKLVIVGDLHGQFQVRNKFWWWCNSDELCQDLPDSPLSLMYVQDLLEIFEKNGMPSSKTWVQ